MNPILLGGALALLAAAPVAVAQQAEPEAGLVALHQALLDAQTDVVVLNVAAHPDDESSRTNTILRRKHGMRVVTAYTTYGDGGQNAIGREIGPELAALRVRETLRAAAMSGVEVRWLGMDDFGFSKTLEETRAKWGDETLLAAMRKVVDEVDPAFVITNHTLTQGHGHHRATFWAIDTALRERAKAGRYVPTLLTRAKVDDAQWVVDPSEVEPARGETYARLAHRAWVQHVTQGPWGPHNPLQVGRDWWTVANGDVRTPIAWDGAPPAMPWLWAPPTTPRAELLAAEVAALPRAALAPAIRAQMQRVAAAAQAAPYALHTLKRAASRAERGDPLERALLALAGVRPEIWLERDEFAVGGDGKANVVVHGAERLTKLAVRCGDRVGTPITAPVRAMVFDGLPVSPAGTVPTPPEPTPPPAAASTAPANAPTSPGPAGRFAVTFPIEPPTGGPEPRFATVQVSFELDGQPFVVTQRLPYTPVPPVQIEWDREVAIVRRGAIVDRTFHVRVANRSASLVSDPVQLRMGPGLAGTSAPGRLTLTAEHAEARVLVKARIEADELTASAGLGFAFQDAEARLPVRVVDVRVPDGMKVLLVRGPDDSAEQALADLGVPYAALSRDELMSAQFEDYTAVLLDIRAYYHRPELAELRDRLQQYCRGGGRVVAMYHKSGEWNEKDGRPSLAPFPLTVGEERVTDESAAVTLLQPGHALLRYPHELGARDFAGWVQERGLNFPKTWDAAWTPLLAMQDPGDKQPHQGALLVTQFGRGDFVYCSLALYRQLRRGHEGALRVLVNLLARG